MIVAATQQSSYFRTVPLHGREEYQTCKELALEEVPALPASAVVAGVTPRSVQYADGRRFWFVHPADKTVIRAYRERRPEEDIEAGAFPTVALYFDEKGPL